MTFELIHGNETKRWENAINFCRNFDTYHGLEYHKLQSDLSKGEPKLLHVEKNGKHAALPFLIREITENNDLPNPIGKDAISTYGYPGAITNALPDRELRVEFTNALKATCNELELVSMFIRQNPLLETDWLFADLPNSLERIGETIAIDLSPPFAKLNDQANSNHKRNLKKTSKLNPSLVIDEKFVRIDSFIQNYEATMKRNKASDAYYFPPVYYQQLASGLANHATLFHCEVDGGLHASLIALHTGEIAQYHLGGTADDWTKSGIFRWLIDQVKVWAKNRGCKYLHLGGGLNSKNDSLLRFKSGFSKNAKSFSVVKLISNPKRYGELLRRHDDQLSIEDMSFFPAYRKILPTSKNASHSNTGILSPDSPVLIADQLKVEFATTIPPSAVLAQATLQTDVFVGDHSIINTSASVDHDCRLGNFVHIAPNATLCGDVHIGEGTHVGAGATVIEGIRIGKWVTVGAGAVVIKDVPDFTTVVGCPARAIKKHLTDETKMESIEHLQSLCNIINSIRQSAGRKPVSELKIEYHLQRDLELDSLELAEMTVLIESKFGVDVFEEEIVTTVRDVLKKLK